jgi:hypothetical protein
MKSGSLGRPPKPAVAAASSSVSGKTFYWRGFVSDRGSVSRPAAHRGRGRGGRGGLHNSGRGDLHTSGGRGRARPAPYQRPGLPRGGRGKNHLSNWLIRHFSICLQLSSIGHSFTFISAVNITDENYRGKLQSIKSASAFAAQHYLLNPIPLKT